MRDPFTSPLPWGGNQWPVDGIAPDPPPTPTQIVPLIAPTVGAISRAASNAATSFTFGVTCNRGDGIVLFVTLGATGATTVSATDNYGDTFNTYGNTFAGFDSSIYLLWLPICTGLNPTITVRSGTSTSIHAFAAQILGANSGWFIDGVQGLHIVSGTTIRPLLRTSEPNDLILMAFTDTGLGGGTSTQGYVSTQAKVPSVSGAFEIVLVYNPTPQPSGSVGPTGTYGTAQAGGITVSIRTQPYTVSQANPPASVYPGIAQYPYISVPPPYAETTVPVVSGNVTENIGSQSGTFTEGIVTEAIDYFPTGQAGTFAEGSVVEAIDLFPAGLSGQFIEGIVTPTGGDVTPVAPPSQAGGTGKPRFKPKHSSEIFEEELARIEAQLTAATKQREAIEAKLEEVEQAVSVPPDARDFVVGIQKAIDRAERRERARQQPITVPVYFRTPAKSVGVERVETIGRLRTLASISRHREEVALERVRKLREKIDEDAASYLMNLLMWEWDDDD